MMKTVGINLSILFFILSIWVYSANNESPQLENNEPLELGSGETDGYKLVWEDLFREPKLNPDNWMIEVNGDGGGNKELQYYKSENITIGKEPETGRSCLIITAKKENYKGKTATSGRLNTKGKYSTKYGKIEASIKLPKTADGLWPAFWMLGSDHPTVGWPKCGEIDILEMGAAHGIKNNIQEKYLNGALHWGPSWNNGQYPNYANHFTSEYGLQNDFHLYTLIWDEKTVKMYLDLDKKPNSKPYFEMSITDMKDENAPGNYFNKDFFVILNLAVGGNFTQIWDINKVTALQNGNAKMYVDYVKIYQK